MEVVYHEEILVNIMPFSGCITNYRNNCLDINVALPAAAHYAKKTGKAMTVFKGAQGTWLIKHKDDVSPVECCAPRHIVGCVIFPNGNVHKIKGFKKFLEEESESIPDKSPSRTEHDSISNK